MYVLAFCPPVIPLLILMPPLFALLIDKERSGSTIASNIKPMLLGFFLGSLAYLALALGFGNLEKFPWNPLQISGLIIPVFVGGIYLFKKIRGEIHFPGFSRGGIGAGILFLLFSATPFILPWVILISDIRVVIAMLFVPVLFGVWILLSVSGYSWKYYTVYVILAVLSALLYAFVLFAFSID